MKELTKLIFAISILPIIIFSSCEGCLELEGIENEETKDVFDFNLNGEKSILWCTSILLDERSYMFSND